MAFGFTPKYVQEISLDRLTEEQFLALCVETAERLHWNIGYLSTTGMVAYTVRTLFHFSAKVTISLENGFAKLKSESTGGELFDMGRNKKTLLSFTDSMNSLKAMISMHELDARYSQLAPHLPPPENDLIRRPARSNVLTGLMSLFRPTKGYFITPILINLNIAVFIVMVLSGVSFLEPDSARLVAWGANFTPLTLNGQWWRLLTNCFVHAGILHLLFNMFALVYIGMLLEPLLGRLEFAVAYLLTGILASLTSLAWHDIILSVGASGAIFGMYGVFLAMLTTNFIEKNQRKSLLTSIGIFVFYNLAHGMNDNIDNAAHVGGLFSGIAIGYLYLPALKQPASRKLGNRVLVTVVVLCLSAAVLIYKITPNYVAIYEAKMKDFSRHEDAALAFYKMPPGASREDSLAALTTAGISNWQQDLKIVTDLQHLRLPTVLKSQADNLVNYCNDRIASYSLRCKAINENSTSYNDSINYYESQVQQILNSLRSSTKLP